MPVVKTPPAVDMSDATSMICKCGNMTYRKVYILKRLSSFVPKNPFGKDIVVDLMLYVCTACNEVCRDIKPVAGDKATIID